MEQFKSEIVSDESESLILVDSDNNEVGTLDKMSCHDGQGVLHRAFSLFVFNDRGQLLLQKRASNKRLWPDYWSNSCCSHPRTGESMELATQRRCHQELGFNTPLEFVYRFEYHAQFGSLGSERELCSVYIGHFNGPLRVNTTEIGDHRWLNAATLDSELETSPEQFTPWFAMEWRHLQIHHPSYLPVS